MSLKESRDLVDAGSHWAQALRSQILGFHCNTILPHPGQQAKEVQISRVTHNFFDILFHYCQRACVAVHATLNAWDAFPAWVGTRAPGNLPLFGEQHPQKRYTYWILFETEKCTNHYFFMLSNLANQKKFKIIFFFINTIYIPLKANSPHYQTSHRGCNDGNLFRVPRATL